MAEKTPEEVLPPSTSVGVVGWLRINLFSSKTSTAISLTVGPLVLLLLVNILRWVVLEADWSPVTESLKLFLVGQYPSEELWRIGVVIGAAGVMMGISWALWGGVIRTFAIIMAAVALVVAVAPVDLAGFSIAVRAWYLSVGVSVGFGLFIGRMLKIQPMWVIRAWVLVFFLGITLIWGFEKNSLAASLNQLLTYGVTLTVVLTVGGRLMGFRTAMILRWVLWAWVALAVILLGVFWGLGQTEAIPRVPTSHWGGLLLTFVLALVGITASFPIGVLFALGRRSSLPVIKILSIIFIEFVRGVPLITLLFMTVVIAPLFFPQGTSFDLVLRALFAITLFSSAYMAENVRGGLQAIPTGQIEGAKALGLGGFQTMLFIVLPQALRAVIPAIVGQFISLFKDTSLVVIVGALDILGIGKSLFLGNVRWFGAQAEVYLFVAFVFWIFTFSMAYASRKTEEALGVGTR
jgi:general L-amino acid transport system permease protein